MTQLPTSHETPASLLAPLARGLMRRAPEILSLSIHDADGHALWSSGDFLLAEDHALIAEVVEDPHDVRGQSCGLWWESADTARARCALALFEGGPFLRRRAGGVLGPDHARGGSRRARRGAGAGAAGAGQGRAPLRGVAA